MVEDERITIRINTEMKETLRKAFEEDLQIFSLSGGIKKMITKYLDARKDTIQIKRSEYEELKKLAEAKRKTDNW